MKEQKNIDRLFQEKFKDFEATPDKVVWANLEKELKKKNERKPFIIPLWYKLAGVAALLALLFWVGQPLLDGNDTDSKVVNTYPDLDEPDNASNDSIVISNKNLIEDSSKGMTSEEGQEPLIQEEKNKTAKPKLNKASQQNDIAETATTLNKENNNSNAEENQSQTLNNKLQQSKKGLETIIVQSDKSGDIKEMTNVERNTAVSTIVDTSENGDKNANKDNSKVTKETVESTKISVAEPANKKSLLEEAYKVAEETLKEEALTEVAAKTKKWEVQPHAAPVYYNGLGGGSAIDPNFSDNTTSTEVSLAYGVNFAYAINERLKVRTGVGKVTHNFNTNEISFGATATPVALRNISQSALNGLFVEIVDTELLERQQLARSNDLLSFDAAQFFEGSINQTLGYIEVPVELEYALIDKKFGVSLIGGASTLFLDENVIAVETRGNINDIGEASNVNSVSFSTNIGLGINYKLTKSLQINLEPTFKYQINTFSDSNNFNPYYLGLYSGFSFKF